MLGAASVFCGVTRVAVASVIVLVEISDNSAMVLPLIVSVVFSIRTANLIDTPPIYHGLMTKKSLPYLGIWSTENACHDDLVAGQVYFLSACDFAM